MIISLPQLIATAVGRGCEASISEVAVLFGIALTGHPFDVSIAVDAKLSEIGLQMIPPCMKGTFESQRLVCSVESQVSVAELKSEVLRGEGATLEFKSTFMYHVDRARSGNYANTSELKSDDVVHSSLKTIAALMNTDGGVLLVGVDDSGNILGIDRDLELLGTQDRNKDGWELSFRQYIETQFYDGKMVNNLVRFSFLQADGTIVARIQVSARGRISYLKNRKTGAYEVYVRQGNRTVSLTLPEFEEYLRTRS